MIPYRQAHGKSAAETCQQNTYPDMHTILKKMSEFLRKRVPLNLNMHSYHSHLWKTHLCCSTYQICRLRIHSATTFLHVAGFHTEDLVRSTHECLVSIFAVITVRCTTDPLY